MNACVPNWKAPGTVVEGGYTALDAVHESGHQYFRSQAGALVLMFNGEPIVPDGLLARSRAEMRNAAPDLFSAAADLNAELGEILFAMPMAQVEKLAPALTRVQLILMRCAGIAP